VKSRAQPSPGGHAPVTPLEADRAISGRPEHGRGLLSQCEQAARAVDDDITTGMPPDQRAALEEALRLLANRFGLP
jgi:hypothetical protein